MSSAMVNIPSDHMMAMASALRMVRDTQTMEAHVLVTSAQHSEGTQCLSNAGNCWSDAASCCRSLCEPQTADLQRCSTPSWPWYLAVVPVIVRYFVLFFPPKKPNWMMTALSKCPTPATNNMKECLFGRCWWLSVLSWMADRHCCKFCLRVCEMMQTIWMNPITYIPPKKSGIMLHC